MSNATIKTGSYIDCVLMDLEELSLDELKSVNKKAGQLIKQKQTARDNALWKQLKVGSRVRATRSCKGVVEGDLGTVVKLLQKRVKVAFDRFEYTIYGCHLEFIEVVPNE